MDGLHRVFVICIVGCIWELGVCIGVGNYSSYIWIWSLLFLSRFYVSFGSMGILVSIDWTTFSGREFFGKNSWKKGHSMKSFFRTSSFHGSIKHRDYLYLNWWEMTGKLRWFTSRALVDDDEVKIRSSDQTGLILTKKNAFFLDTFSWQPPKAEARVPSKANAVITFTNVWM